MFRRYLASKSEKGRQTLLGSEGSIRKLGVDDPVPPTYRELKFGDETIRYWFKMMNVVLSKRLAEKYDPSWRRLKFTIGADHGAKAEQLGVKIEAFSESGGDAVHSEVFRLAEIECKHETSEILLEALAKHLNEAIEEMLKEGVNAEGETPDGLLKFHTQKDGDDKLPDAEFLKDYAPEALAASCFEPNTDSNSHEIPFKIHVTGDMKWYGVAQGKEHSDRNWCWICMLKKLEWQLKDEDGKAKVGELWTLDALYEIANSLDENEKSFLGVKSEPMLKRIGPDRYDLPLLHILLGLANDLLENLVDYVEKRHGLERCFGVSGEKEATDELKKCWEEYHNALAVVFAKRKELADWDASNKMTLMELRIAKQYLIDMLRAEDLTPEEKREIKTEKEGMFREIERLRLERKALEDAKATAVKSFEVKEQNLDGLQDADEATHRIRTRIDQEALYPFGIDRPAEHGGKLAGRGCKNLMGNAKDVFEIIKSILDEEASSANMSTEGKEELKVFCEYTRDCLILFDGFFSAMRTPGREMDTPEKKNAVKESAQAYLEAAIDLWIALSLSMTPKCHVAFAHAISMLPVDIDAEEWVERLHQIRLKMLARLRGQRDRARRCAYESRREQQNRVANVEAIQEHVRQQRALPESTAAKRRESRRRRETSEEQQQQTGRRRKNDSEDRAELREETLASWKGREPRKLPTAEELNVKEATTTATT